MSQPFPRSDKPRLARVLCAGATATALILALSACTAAGSTPPASTTDTIVVPFSTPMSTADPDQFYALEGNLVMTNVYEGLVGYAAETTDLEPRLAKSWEVSPDGLSITFAIREGVTFSDGTPLDAEAVRTSFQRRIDLALPSSYMLYSVADMSVPDPMTLVLTLSAPDSALLDYLASTWGPKVISPRALEENAGDDQAQTWLNSNSAGTGPYTITGWDPSSGYELTARDDYWGGAPEVTTVSIPIIPDPASQRLQLESGDIDMILNTLSTTDLDALGTSDAVSVTTSPSLSMIGLLVNPHSGAFADAGLRSVLPGAVDWDKLVSQAYGAYGATTSADVYPSALLPGADVDKTPRPDASTVVSSAADKTVNLQYTAGESQATVQLAELIATSLNSIGFQVEVTTRQYGETVDPTAADAPDLILASMLPDTGNADAFARVWYTPTGYFNLLQCSDPGVAPLLDQGLTSLDPAAQETAYLEAGRLEAGSGCIVPLADIQSVVVARDGISGIEQDPASISTLRLDRLRIS